MTRSLGAIMDTKELVLQLGVEGGGASFYRTAVDAGGYRFHIEGISMCLDENDEERWHQWTTTTVGIIEEALQSLAVDGSWIYWHPMSVLREYRSTVWQCVQETLLSVGNASPERWHRSRLQWMAICSAE